MRAFLSISRFVLLGLALLPILVSQVQGSVNSLLPGTVIPAQPSLFPIGGTVLQSLTSPFSSAVMSGTLSSQVLSGDTSNPYAGGLTFTYRLTLSPNSTDDASQVSISSFANFLTDVSYNLSLGGIGPTTFSRSGGTGNVIRFNFVPTTVSPGSSSALIVVQTSSLNWNPTTAGIIDGMTINVAALAPLAVPEPAVATLFLAGLALVLGRKLRK